MEVYNKRKLLINGNDIGFFFGAGASIEFGIPSMKPMTMNFFETINNNSDFSDLTAERILFNDIYNTMKDIYGKDNVDIESIMSVIVSLKDQKNFENIGEFPKYLFNKYKIDYKQLIQKYKIDTINSLETIYKNHVSDQVLLKQKGITLLRKVYVDFFRQICKIVGCSNQSDGIPNLNDPYENTIEKWTFFTTNYDTAIENYWVRYRNYNLDLGFKKDSANYPIIYANDFVNRNLSNSYNAMQLVKLHGSVNWVLNNKGETEEHDYNQNYQTIKDTSAPEDIIEDLMIYPNDQKDLFFSPFIQFFNILDAELNKRNIWIIVGYSFRDLIIRKMFEKALKTKKRKIILVNPDAEKIKILFSDQFHSQIECIEKYFAKEDNYEEVNKEIAGLISKYKDS